MKIISFNQFAVFTTRYFYEFGDESLFEMLLSDSSLFLNCGGTSYTVNGNTYEGDQGITGDTVYSVSSKGNWAFTSTGWFMDNGNPSYTPTNTTSLLMSDPTLYMTARTSPITMTYYGLCLQNGNYNVSLHFAEIIFTNDQTYTSLGERVFDVYIQVKKFSCYFGKFF